MLLIQVRWRRGRRRDLWTDPSGNTGAVIGFAYLPTTAIWAVRRSKIVSTSMWLHDHYRSNVYSAVAP